MLGLLFVPTQGFSQSNDENNGEHGDHYKFAKMKRAEFSFEKLGTQKLLNIPYVGSTNEKDLKLNYAILLQPNGKVSFVRAPRCEEEQKELRDGAVRALYDAEFSSSMDTVSHWVEVVVFFPGLSND